MQDIITLYTALGTGNLALVGSLLVAFCLRGYIQFAFTAVIPRFVLAVAPRWSWPSLFFFGEIFFNISYAFDKFVSLCLPGPYWKPGRTISYRIGRMAADGNIIGRFVCAALHPWDHNHCAKAVEADSGDQPFFKWHHAEEFVNLG